MSWHNAPNLGAVRVLPWRILEGKWQFSAVGTALEYPWECTATGGPKRENEMSKSSLKNAIAISAALVMSAVTVGAAVGPAQAGTVHVAAAVRA